jgi:hypothetical protein
MGFSCNTHRDDGADISGYIVFNIAMVFAITWLWFGGYKKLIQSTAGKALKHSNRTDGDKEGTNLAAEPSSRPKSEFAFAE